MTLEQSVMQIKLLKAIEMITTGATTTLTAQSAGTISDNQFIGSDLIKAANIIILFNFLPSFVSNKASSASLNSNDCRIRLKLLFYKRK